MATRAQMIAARFQKWIDTILPSQADTGTQTTFTLYRRSSGTQNDLGVKPQSWSALVAGQHCTYLGVPTDVRMHFTAVAQGTEKARMILLWTTYTGVQEGDTVKLAADNRYYLVQSIAQEGSVYQVLLNGAGKMYQGA